MSILRGEMQSCHSIIAGEIDPCSRRQQVSRHVCVPKATGDHKRRFIRVIECINFGPGLNQNMGSQDMIVRGCNMEWCTTVGLNKLNPGRGVGEASHFPHQPLVDTYFWLYVLREIYSSALPGILLVYRSPDLEANRPQILFYPRVKYRSRYSLSSC